MQYPLFFVCQLVLIPDKTLAPKEAALPLFRSQLLDSSGLGAFPFLFGNEEDDNLGIFKTHSRL